MGTKAFERLRAFREGKELTLEQLAEKLGCSPAWLSLIERGEATPGSGRLLHAIEDVTGISARQWPDRERKPRKRKAA